MIISGNSEIGNLYDLCSIIKRDWDDHQTCDAGSGLEDPRHGSFIYQYQKHINDERASRLAFDIQGAIEGRYGQVNQYRLVEALCRAYSQKKISYLKALQTLYVLFDKDARSVGIRNWTDKIIATSQNKKEAADIIFNSETSKLPAYKDAQLFRIINKFFSKIKDSDGSYDDDIRLLSEYINYSGTSGIGPGKKITGRLSDKRYLDRFERLYEGVIGLGDRAHEAYIPVGFDECTGAGVFIAGENKVSKRALEQYVKTHHRKRNAYIAVIYFENWYDINDDEPMYGDIMVGYSMALFDVFEEAVAFLRERTGMFVEKYMMDDASGIWNPYDEDLFAPLTSEEEKIIMEYADKENRECLPELIFSKTGMELLPEETIEYFREIRSADYQRVLTRKLSEYTRGEWYVCLYEKVLLEQCLPYFMEELDSDPLTPGLFYKGEVLYRITLIDKTFWRSHKDWLEHTRTIVHRVLNMNEENLDKAAIPVTFIEAFKAF